jgi:hypothetical protein
MRTTLTLEGDLADRLKQLAADDGISFKDAVNRTLRAGLEARSAPRPHRTPARPMALRTGIDVTKALRLAEGLENEEIVLEMSAGR